MGGGLSLERRGLWEATPQSPGSLSSTESRPLTCRGALTFPAGSDLGGRDGGPKLGFGSRGWPVGLSLSFLPGIQPGQTRGFLPEERGERASGQAAEAEAAERSHIPPRLPRARRPGPRSRRQGSPPTSQRSSAPFLAPATVTPASRRVCDLGGQLTAPGGSCICPAPFPDCDLPLPFPPPHPQTEQKYFYKQRIFFMSYQIELEMQGGRGPAGEWGVGGPLPRSSLIWWKALPPQGPPQQGRAPPPFLSTELPQGETGTSLLPSPEVLLLGGDTLQAVTLWTVCAITSTKDLCWGAQLEALGDPLKHCCLTLCHLLLPFWG